ncbi:MAG: adenylyltransferase/cytidyltransferase family protein [Verrucomicrobia bacterium]|nr:adenylyltransferase/cytidyltransferase family protein [Verrucomicrobiota bacterium]
MNCREKILLPGTLASWRDSQRSAGKKLVVTNGCFDILHAGHAAYLEAARNLGDALLVGVNADASVRQLKGPARPLNTEADRALVLASLACVDAVCVFGEVTAENFLKLAKPDIYAKGGDNTLDTINQEERRFVESMGGRVIIVPGVPGRSTSGLLEKIRKL